MPKNHFQEFLKFPFRQYKLCFPFAQPLKRVAFLFFRSATLFFGEKLPSIKNVLHLYGRQRAKTANKHAKYVFYSHAHFPLVPKYFSLNGTISIRSLI